MLDDGGDYDDVNDVNDDDNDDKDDDGEARINVPEWERLAVLGRGLSSKAIFSLAQDWVRGHLQIVVFVLSLHYGVHNHNDFHCSTFPV